MPTGLIVLCVVAFIGVVVVVWAVATYNRLIRLRNEVKEDWAQIDVQLKRRYDLIPNLVETVKGYATHEQDTLDKVVQARGAAMGAQSPKDRMQAEGLLGAAMGKLMLVVEQYPDLKANQNFLSLQSELSRTEDKVSGTRQQYNNSVKRYNTKIQSFPDNMIAGFGGFKEEGLFEVNEPTVREVPKVKF